jgi:RecJ-like exonuclease
VYIEENCSFCSGSGKKIVELSGIKRLFFGAQTEPCQVCHGNGRVLVHAVCSQCHGHGLIGGSRHTCRTCNGTGKLDSFSELPRSLMVPGTRFTRRCESCAGSTFELRCPIGRTGPQIANCHLCTPCSAVSEQRIAVSWHFDDDLREYEDRHAVEVACVDCGLTYNVTLDKTAHAEYSENDFERRKRLVKLEEPHRCSNVQCEHYCPKGSCSASDSEFSREAS